MLDQLLAKLSICRLSIGGTRRWYFMRASSFSSSILELDQNEALRRLEAIGSSHFYLEQKTQTLFKLAKDKYGLCRRPVKWLFRDILDKRLLGGSDAVKEWHSNRILRQAGLQAVECRGVGVALSVFNSFGSAYAMPYLDELESGETYFRKLEETSRLAFVRQLCDDAFVLARHGYYHRDLHYGNVMVGHDGKLIWIDTHIRRLPRAKDKRKRYLIGMLSPTKLQGQRYRNYAEHYLLRKFETATGLDD